MGHRALVALEGPDGRFDCYRSQWGAHRWRLARTVTDGTDPLDAADLDCSPVATDCAFDAVVTEHVDFQSHEALFVVAGGTVRPFLVCWVGIPGVDRNRPGDGALVAVDPDEPVADGEYLRGWFEGTKAAALAMVDRGAFDPGGARGWLVARLGAWADERTVAFGPARR